MIDWRAEAAVWGRLAAHQKRLDQARRTLDEIAHRGRFVVSSSWGKDSTALVGLALEMFAGDLEVLHLVSPYKLPGGEHVERHFAERCLVHNLPYRKTLAEYIEWLGQVGLTHERFDHRAARGKSDRAAEWCREQGISTMALGLRAEESKTRAKFLRHRGLVCHRVDGMTVANPIGFWTSRDVWAYIHSRDLPYHRMYDAETHGMTRHVIRNAGWLTTDDPGRVTWMQRHFPHEYRQLEAAFPRVRMLT